MFGNNLKKYRQQKGFSQGELARELYVTRQCISKWEKGVTQPDLGMLTRISELLDVSVDTLLKDDDIATKEHSTGMNRCLFIVNLLVALFCALAYLSLWRFLPPTIPAHWMHGKIDRYGDSAEILLHLISVIIFLIVDVVLFVILRKIFNNKIIAFTHSVIIFLQTAYLIFVVALYARYLAALLSFLTCLSACLILCFSIAMHPKISKQNQWLGVRTHETLSNETVWNKTNTLACYLCSLVSLAIIIVNILVISVWSCIGLVAYVVPAVIAIIYSKSISKVVKEEKRNDKTA